MNDCDRNTKGGVATGWDFNRAGNLLPTRGGCVPDSKSFAILTGCQNHEEKRQYKTRN
jgi:hypothetical protein